MILPKHTIAVALILSVISATILVAPAQEKPLPTQPEALYIFPRGRAAGLDCGGKNRRADASRRLCRVDRL